MRHTQCHKSVRGDVMAKSCCRYPKKLGLNRWRRFAREMSTDLDCFRVIDATLPVRDVQRQIADILDIE